MLNMLKGKIVNRREAINKYGKRKADRDSSSQGFDGRTTIFLRLPLPLYAWHATPRASLETSTLISPSSRQTRPPPRT